MYGMRVTQSFSAIESLDTSKKKRKNCNIFISVIKFFANEIPGTRREEIGFEIISSGSVDF
jgi:hypothetical protein